MIAGKLYQVYSEYSEQTVFWKGWNGLSLYSKSVEDIYTGDSVVYLEQINSARNTMLDLTYYKLLTSKGNLVYVLATGGLSVGDPCIAGRLCLKPLEI